VSTLDEFLAQGWADHAERADAVAARLPQAIGRVADDDGAVRLAALAHHVLGEHLGRWREGLDFLAALAAHGRHGPGGAAALARQRASLRLSGALGDDRPGMNEGDRCRVAASAAANLAVRDAPRAGTLLDEAAASAVALADDDPGVRAVAAAGNNIAATLRDIAETLDATQRRLMLHAAALARSHWQRAGTWLEMERAEYRLAVSHVAAGDAARGLQHADLCEAMVRHNGAEPFELFYAAEAQALAAQALSDRPRLAAALASARAAYDVLPPDAQQECRPALDKLARL
jgi:hypothetical protein